MVYIAIYMSVYIPTSNKVVKWTSYHMWTRGNEVDLSLGDTWMIVVGHRLLSSDLA
jgi:hypothetical protein